ncbi:hypothetical protein MMC31_005319, partial [Peltigera leucophlebia]|nr:hypothetical protein [Peltigera leucophlebia]
MAETRESVIQDITLLTRFASAQRVNDLNNSAFSRSRVDADLAAFRNLRNPSMPPLSRGFLDSRFDPRTSQGKQRSEEILKAFATIFAGSGDCIAVGAVRDDQKKVVQMIIGGNGNISTNQKQQIDDLYMGLKEIAVVSEQLAARQFHSTNSGVLKDSPPAKTYDSDLVCVAKINKFHAMVTERCLKKIARRFKRYSTLFDRVGEYLTPIFRKGCGVENYLFTFQRLKLAIEKLSAFPALWEDEDLMDYVLFAFQKLHLARNGIDFKALNDELLIKERLNNQSQKQIRDRIRLCRSFRKLLITRDSMTVLTKMALSPHLRSIFLDFKFKPVYLPEEKGLAPPMDVDFWMRKFQAMSILGSRSEDGAEDVEEARGSQDGGETGFEDGEQTRGSQGSGGARWSEDVEETRGSQDGEETRESEDGEETGSKNGEETPGFENGRETRRSKFDPRSELIKGIQVAIGEDASCQVHAEVKVLSHLHRHGLIDKAINSFGINKLCCPACLCSIFARRIGIQVGAQVDERDYIIRFQFDWMKHLSNLRQRSPSFGNHSESSCGDAEPEEGISLFKNSYDDDKFYQAGYDEEIEAMPNHKR